MFHGVRANFWWFVSFTFLLGLAFLGSGGLKIWFFTGQIYFNYGSRIPADAVVLKPCIFLVWTRCLMFVMFDSFCWTYYVHRKKFSFRSVFWIPGWVPISLVAYPGDARVCDPDQKASTRILLGKHSERGHALGASQCLAFQRCCLTVLWTFCFSGSFLRCVWNLWFQW